MANLVPRCSGPLDPSLWLHLSSGQGWGGKSYLALMCCTSHFPKVKGMYVQLPTQGKPLKMGLQRGPWQRQLEGMCAHVCVCACVWRGRADRAEAILTSLTYEETIPKRQDTSGRASHRPAKNATLSRKGASDVGQEWSWPAAVPFCTGQPAGSTWQGGQ